jgi:cytochrome c oxidase cbb3-type subunit I/II
VKSSIDSAPVLDAAKRLDIWAQMGWHRRWERLPVRFTVWVVIAVLAASLFEMIPTFLIRGNIPTIASVTPYTPLELAGRDIYVAEGCYNCHSQQIRPMVAETKRYGDYSKPGEFIYDHPFQWGSRRIGPDLAREGGRQSSFWHWQHFENPQIIPGSVMPPFLHLLVAEIDRNKIKDRVWAAQMLGAKYDFSLDEVPEISRKQSEAIAAEIVSQGGPVQMDRIGKPPLLTIDSQAVALIAYLQRLGVDLMKPPPLAPGTAPAAPAPADAPVVASGPDKVDAAEPVAVAQAANPVASEEGN